MKNSLYQFTKHTLLVTLFGFLFCCTLNSGIKENGGKDHNLEFNSLPKVWDEGMPLGNGFIGALVWQKDNNLRFSLDRVDLWDLRPMENLSRPEFSFGWVQQQVKNNTYKEVQDMFDKPYNKSPAPTKLPGAALEFPLDNLGNVKNVTLDINKALCHVEWGKRGKP